VLCAEVWRGLEHSIAGCVRGMWSAGQGLAEGSAFTRGQKQRVAAVSDLVEARSEFLEFQHWPG
jgi:hypothetical protein